MDILNTIKDGIETTENNNSNIDSSASSDVDESTTIIAGSSTIPTDEQDDDNVILNKLDPEIDNLRDIANKYLAAVITVRDIMKSKFNVDITDAIFDITDDLFSKIAKTKYVNSSILTLQQMDENEFTFKVIPSISDNPKSFGYLVGIAFKPISASIDQFPNINFDEIGYHVRMYNNIVDKISVRRYLMMINSFLIPYVNLVRRYNKQIDMLDINFKNDIDNISSQQDAIDFEYIFNYKTDMIAISNTYRIYELQDILFPLNQALQYNYNWLDLALLGEEATIYRRINNILSIIDEKYLDSNLIELKNKLNQSDIYKNDYTDFSAFIYNFTTMSNIIKIFSTACGIVTVKKGQTRNRTEFVSLVNLYKELIDEFDMDLVKQELTKAMNLIDKDILQFSHQVGMKISKISSPTLGFDPEFIEVLKLLIDIKEHYEELLNDINSISTEQDIFKYYFAAYLVGGDIKKYVEELNKILENFSSDPKVLNKFSKLLHKIKDHEDDLQYVTKLMKTLVTSNNIDNIISRATNGLNMFSYMKKLNEIIQDKKLEKKYSLNLEDIGGASYNREYIKQSIKQIELFEEFAVKLYDILVIIRNLINNMLRIYTAVYKSRYELIGYNNISTDLNFNDFNFNDAVIELIGFLKTSSPVKKINHTPFEITFDDIDRYKESLRTSLNSIYQEIIKISIKYKLGLPNEYIKCTIDDLAKLNTNNLTDSEKEIVKNFKLLLSLEKVMIYAKPLDATFSTDELNEHLEYINFAITNAKGYTETDLQNKLYFTEVFKNEINDIASNIEKTGFSYDVNLLLYKTPPGFTIGNKFPTVIGSIRSYKQLLESAYYHINSVLDQFGNYDQFVDDLSKSASISMNGSQVWFNFDEDEITEYRLYSEQYILFEDTYKTVLNQFVSFMSQIKDAIIEYEYVLNLIENINDTTKPKNTSKKIGITYKNIDLLPNDSKYEEDLNVDYHRVYITATLNQLFSDKGKSIIESDLIQEKLELRKNEAINIQYSIPPEIKDIVFTMRSKIIAYQEKSDVANTLAKLDLKTKKESDLFETTTFNEETSTPLIIYKDKIEPLITYEGQDSNYSPYVSNGVSYNTLLRISKDTAIYKTNYLVTDDSGTIRQLIKVYHLSPRVYGGFKVRLKGYGFIDGSEIKYTTDLNIANQIQLYDTNNLESKLVKLPYKYGYSNTSHTIIINGKKYNPFVYGKGTLLGLISEDGNILVGKDNRPLQLDDSNYVGVSKYLQLNELDNSFRVTSLKGLNSEVNNSLTIKVTTATNENLNLIFKDGMYQVKDSSTVVENKIFNLYGNSLKYAKINDTDNLTVKFATGKTKEVYRIISPTNYLISDYFIAVKSDFTDNFILVSPQMLDSNENIYQQTLSNLNNKYPLFDKYSEKLKVLLDLNYNPTRAVTSISRYPYLYTLKDTISLNDEQYNKVVNIHGDYVGITNGYDVIFDIKIKPNNTETIYNDYIETVYVTSTGI